jgi:hypothetical protein
VLRWLPRRGPAVLVILGHGLGSDLQGLGLRVRAGRFRRDLLERGLGRGLQGLGLRVREGHWFDHCLGLGLYRVWCSISGVVVHTSYLVRRI